MMDERSVHLVQSPKMIRRRSHSQKDKSIQESVELDFKKRSNLQINYFLNILEKLFMNIFEIFSDNHLYT